MKQSLRVIGALLVLATALFAMGCNGQPQFIVVLGLANEGGGSGSIDVSATSNGLYDAGIEVTANATPDEGSAFMGWFDAESGGSLVSADNPYTFVLNADTYLYAMFGPAPGTDTALPTVAVSVLRDGGTVQSGFLVGTASDDTGVTAVEVKLDGGDYSPAGGTAAWSYQLPSGSATWRDGSEHVMAVRSQDAVGNYSIAVVLTVRKGMNRDLNGDGYADLVISAGNYNSYQGRAYVFHGGPAGVADQDAASADAVLTGEAPNDCFGNAIATGDVNGDGYGDLCIGAYNAGVLYVFEGGPSGTGIRGAASADTIINGDPADLGGHLARTLSTGDVNGDGYTDVAAGADSSNALDGRAFVLLGSSTGIASRVLGGGGPPDSTISPETPDLHYLLGKYVLLADINGDGYADLVTRDNLQAYIFEASAAGIPDQTTATADTTLGNAGAVWTRWAHGDFNGDGCTDLALGNPGAGAVYIIKGGSAGISSADVAVAADTTITEADTGFGNSLGSGDVDGDGIDDLAVGAPGYNSGQGRAYLFEGTPAGIADQSAGFAVATGAAVGDFFGGAVSILGLNGDSFADLAVGAAEYGTSQGRAYVFSGGSGGISTRDLSGSGVADTTITGEAGTGQFGSPIAP